MAEVSLKNYRAAMTWFDEPDEKQFSRLQEREILLDRMADASSQYLIRLSPHVLLEADDRNLNFQLKALSYFERIGDLSVNIANDLHELKGSNTQFSEAAMAQLRIAADAVGDVLQLTTDAYKNNSISLARRVEPLEEVIDELIEYLRELHIRRMTKGECNVVAGLEFQNILQNLERLSDQCSDLAVYLLARSDDSINGHEHQYIHNLHHSDNEEYLQDFRNNYDKYLVCWEMLLLILRNKIGDQADTDDYQYKPEHAVYFGMKNIFHAFHFLPKRNVRAAAAAIR